MNRARSVCLHYLAAALCGLVALVVALPAPARAASESLSLEITGVHGELRANVETVLTIPNGIVRDGIVNRLWLRRFVKKVPSRVRQALEPFGYYHSETTVEATGAENGHFVIEVGISPGPETVLAEAEIVLTGAGRDHPRLRQQRDAFPLQQGSVLRHDRYEKGKAQLENAALDLGYIKAEFTTHTINVDLAANRAHLSLVLDTGPRYYFGAVTFPSPPSYPERFLRRYLAVRPGAVFSYAALGRTQSRFIDSDRFKRVVVTPRTDDAADFRVPVEIRLESKPQRTLRPGIGYGTDTGTRFSLLYRDINVWQRAHQLDADLVIAEYRQTFDMSYVFPHYRNINSYTAIKGGLNREETDTYVSRKIFVELENVYGRSKRNILSLFARLQREDYQVGASDETSELLIPGARWSYRTYISPTRPQKGYHIALEVRGTREGVLSDTSLLQTIGEANTLVPLPARMSLFLRGRGATTLQQNEFESIPASMRFFAGGDRSVRGYAYQSLGPVDADGNVIGGKHLLVGSVELEREITRNWSIAAFYDIGNAFNNLADYELVRGAGLGLRWYTLVGPVRIDVARQVNYPDPSYRLHFSMGFTW